MPGRARDCATWRRVARIDWLGTNLVPALCLGNRAEIVHGFVRIIFAGGSDIMRIQLGDAGKCAAECRGRRRAAGSLVKAGGTAGKMD
mgnify:CR=1 FL=1